MFTYLRTIYKCFIFYCFYLKCIKLNKFMLDKTTAKRQNSCTTKQKIDI